MNINEEKGFTLVELSIVLVIIGLIVGGVVGGQSLIKSARMGKIVSQLQGYKVAFNSFELQYDAIPRDLARHMLIGVQIVILLLLNVMGMAIILLKVIMGPRVQTTIKKG